MAFLKQVRNYILTEVLGSGQFGEVFKGTDAQGNVVAVKCIPIHHLDVRLSKYLQWEITTMQQITSPHVIRLYEVIQTEHNLYLIMEYCGGGDLEKVMREAGTLPMHLVKRWLTNIVDAFITLKANKVMHRDLKPANILLTHSDWEQAEAKLADFGLAKYDSKLEACLDHTILGSPLYMAPEVLNSKPYNAKVDVWSFGVLASNLLGTGVFAGIGSLQMLHERQRDWQLQMLNLPEDATQMLRGALNYDSQSRLSFEQLRALPFFQPASASPSLPIALPSPQEAADMSILNNQKLQMSYCLHRGIKAVWELGLVKSQEKKTLLAFGIFQICLKWKKRYMEEIQQYLAKCRDPDMERLLEEAETAAFTAEMNLTDPDLSRSVVQFGDEGCQIAPRLFSEEAEQLANRTYYSQDTLEEKLKHYNEALGLLLMAKDENQQENQQVFVDWLCKSIEETEQLLITS